MTIKEMNAILRDKSKQNLTCNFKLTGGHKITLEDIKIGLVDVMNEIKSIKSEINSIKSEINSIKSEINSIKSRLDEHDKMFRAHGWIK